MIRRVVVFVAICIAAAVAAVVALVHASGSQTPASRQPAAAYVPVASFAGKPRLVFRSTDVDAVYGRVAVVALHDPAGARAITGLGCERVDFTGERGICLRAHRGLLTTYDAVIFDSRFRALRTFKLAGGPSRARIRRDGHVAAYTVFVSGHSYAGSSFSTRTAFVDTRTGKELSQLENFTVRRGGRVLRRVDFNFWGVTFGPGPNSFYATLGTRSQTYLIYGDFSARTARVLRSGVECPSLSPDGRWIAFKERIHHGLGPVTWRLDVLDVRTLRAHRLAETRNVDDQVEWLDNEHILYGISEPSTAVTDVWSVRADGTGKPHRALVGGWSPSVVVE
jgi:hypothetical protein